MSFGYPNSFKSLKDANTWVKNFVYWYNYTHLHSEIKFVTPYSRHTGADQEILNSRKIVYEQAKANNPLRWFQSKIKNWDKPLKVGLNNPNLRKGRQSVMVEAA